MATAGSNYASQRDVFNDLGQGVLNNAYEGTAVLLLVAFFQRSVTFKSLKQQYAPMGELLEATICSNG